MVTSLADHVPHTTAIMDVLPCRRRSSSVCGGAFTMLTRYALAQKCLKKRKKIETHSRAAPRPVVAGLTISPHWEGGKPR
jgi:hypothetical protein